MGKIVVRAQQQKVYNLGGSGESANAYVLRPVRYTTMTADDIVSYCATNSIVPKAYIHCYALRQLSGLRTSSNTVEKSNDINVAQRQKHNGMSPPNS